VFNLWKIGFDQFEFGRGHSLSLSCNDHLIITFG
jgi:hypothetical protein